MRVHTTTKTRRLVPGVLFAAVAVLSLVAAGCHPVGSGGPSSPNHPIGVLESVVGGNGNVRIVGWATDNWSGLGHGLAPAAGPRVPATVVVVLNGQWVSQAFIASGPRSDVGAVLATNAAFERYRQPGDAYGFDFTLPAPPGPTTVCVGAVNSAYPGQVMTAEQAAAAGRGLGTYADHSFIGCASTTVT